MTLTNTEYRGISHAIGVLRRAGAEINVTTGGDSGGQLSITLTGYNPPDSPAPGDPPATVRYLLELITDQTGYDMSDDAHVVSHLEGIVPSLRKGSATSYQIPFSVLTERGREIRYLTVNPRDPRFQELPDP